jgi:hypothetical protein
MRACSPVPRTSVVPRPAKPVGLVGGALDAQIQTVACGS